MAPLGVTKIGSFIIETRRHFVSVMRQFLSRANMWKFTDGVESGEKEVDKFERDKRYDTSRKRCFHELLMGFCSVCHVFATSKADRLCSFISGCCNFQLESVSVHEKSELHPRCGTRHRPYLSQQQASPSVYILHSTALMRRTE